MNHHICFYTLNSIFAIVYYFDLCPKSHRYDPYWPWEYEKYQLDSADNEFIDENYKVNLSKINNKDENEKSENIGKYKNYWNDLKKDTIKTLLINQFILFPLFTLPSLLLNKCFFKISEDDINMSLSDMWNFTYIFTELLPQIAFCSLCDDFMFYWSHKFLHNKYLYSLIHKHHHKYIMTVSWAAEFAHPIEFVLGNMAPVLLGIILIGKKMRMFTFTFYIWLKLVNTTVGHSGIDYPFCFNKHLPFGGNDYFHNYHHAKFTGNYGGFLSLWDFLIGTFNRNYVKERIHENKSVEKKIK